MKKFVRYLAVISATIGIGVGVAWADSSQSPQTSDQNAQTGNPSTEHTTHRHDRKLRSAIASPVTGALGPGAQMGWGGRTNVGGDNGNGFMSSSTGQPMTQPSGTSGNP